MGVLGKAASTRGLIMTEAERRLLLLMAELMIVLLDHAGLTVFADDVFEARHAVATEGLDPEKISPNCTRPDSSLR